LWRLALEHLYQFCFLCWAKKMIYTHVLNKGPLGVRSPLDQ
jgi:hypothetical protein